MLFEFYAYALQFTPSELVIKFEFANPLLISIGQKLDIVRVTVIRPDLFIVKDSGKTVANGTKLEIEIPRQYSSEAEWLFMQTASSVMTASTETAGLS